jgi:hypothetical protein
MLCYSGREKPMNKERELNEIRAKIGYQIRKLYGKDKKVILYSWDIDNVNAIKVANTLKECLTELELLTKVAITVCGDTNVIKL